VRTPHALVAHDGLVDGLRLFQCKGHRLGIDQREIGALSQLRASPMRGVANSDDPSAVPGAEAYITIGCERQGIETFELIHQRRDIRPRVADARFQGFQTLAADGLVFRESEAPEERDVRLIGRRTGNPANRKNSDHCVRTVIALAELSAESARGIAACRPKRTPLIERRRSLGRPCVAQRVVRAGAVENKVEWSLASAIASEQYRSSGRLDGRGIETQAYRHGCLAERTMKDVEQCRSVDAEAAGSGREIAVAQIHHHAPSRRAA